MSGFSAYFQDENIALTTIYASNEGQTYTGRYDDPAIEKTGFSGSLRFTAEAEEGYEFYRWVYRVGEDKASSAVATVQYSTSNPFTYSGDGYITIRAEATESGSGGGGDEEEWSLHAYSRGEITAGISMERTMGEWDLYRIGCKFAVSGTVQFYSDSESGVDPAGYITTTTDWDKDKGVPILEKDENWDDDSGGGTDFSLEIEVEAGKMYYFWWNLFDWGEGSVTVYIIPPGGSEPDEGGGLYIHDGSGWRRCIPFVTDAGWTSVTPCIHDGRQWIKGTTE